MFFLYYRSNFRKYHKFNILSHSFPESLTWIILCTPVHCVVICRKAFIKITRAVFEKSNILNFLTKFEKISQISCFSLLPPSFPDLLYIMYNSTLCSNFGYIAVIQIKRPIFEILTFFERNFYVCLYFFQDSLI